MILPFVFLILQIMFLGLSNSLMLLYTFALFYRKVDMGLLGGIRLRVLPGGFPVRRFTPRLISPELYCFLAHRC